MNGLANFVSINVMASIKLQKFNIASIKQDSVIVFIGRRRTGKSYLVKDLLFYHRDIPIGTVISGTEMANKYYGYIIPPVLVHNECTPALLESVVLRQQKIKSKIEAGSKNIDPRALLILDDCLYDPSWIKDKNIRCLFMNGRHYSMLVMITMQYPLGIPPNLRTNIDYSFILRDNNLNNRRRIYENYASMFPTFEMFCTVMDQCTENYECLVIKNDASSNKLQDQVFWYKAEPHTDFRMCCKELWEASAVREAKSKEQIDDDMIDITKFGKKKSPHFNVIKS
jgi:hypothetical protein